jgi:hypothetical protein
MAESVARRRRSIPLPFGAKPDAINWLGLRSFPLNTNRVRNILTKYIFDTTETERVCCVLPFTVEEGVIPTARWFRELRAVVR